MNRGRFIGGIICFALAVLIAVLIFALPEGKVVFMMGEDNVPWVPAIALAGIGAALITSSWRQAGA